MVPGHFLLGICNHKLVVQVAKHGHRWVEDILLWAHGLHLLFFSVWPVYSLDVCLDRLPSIPQNLRTFGDC